MTPEEILTAAGVRGFLHARRVDGAGPDTGFGIDEPVVLSSVVKVPLVLEFARQAAAGQLDPRDRVRARAADRLGGAGSAGCADDVEYSLRDAARLAISVSDNTAADLLFDRVGVENVRSLTAELGLAGTRIFGSPRDVLRTILDDGEAGRPLRALDPACTSAGTPREMTELLSLIWRDEAGPPSACALVRDLMGRQVNWHRLTAGFPAEVAVAGKTGTMPGLRNEIGVASYPDGTDYAIAVFTRGGSENLREPAIDRAIGEAARTAVEQLRA
ncbi:serine hydrolase [Amycolatopsis saalfeldensis]|uniref:Beta-lactamase class A n=1 Tax=Amycolatopsis saalfeldensis TaxID=394193 RepID=A0A1H8YKT2_9PSEU|nr:serine hydrolase [Amycolatopsis saalfeldensis]SEP52760.1 beta-lactamase class A [Amycolatopsis saalfeldensis]